MTSSGPVLSSQYCTVLCNIYLKLNQWQLYSVLVSVHYEILSVEVPNMKPIITISAHQVHDPSPRLHCFCGSNLEVSYQSQSHHCYQGSQYFGTTQHQYERGVENDAFFLAWSNKRRYTDNAREQKVPVYISLIRPKWCMAESTIKLHKCMQIPIKQ